MAGYVRVKISAGGTHSGDELERQGQAATDMRPPCREIKVKIKKPLSLALFWPFRTEELEAVCTWSQHRYKQYLESWILMIDVEGRKRVWRRIGIARLSMFK